MSGALSEMLTGRLAFRTDQGGSWQQSQTRDDELGRTNRSTARLLLDFRSTDQLNFVVNLVRRTGRPGTYVVPLHTSIDTVEVPPEERGPSSRRREGEPALLVGREGGPQRSVDLNR